MTKILVPTDFSENSEKALLTALRLAYKSKSSIVLLNVLDYSAHLAQHADSSITAEWMSDIYGILKEQSDKMLNDLCIKHKQESVQIHPLNQSGFFKDVLLEVLNTDPQINLIVMGSKGTSGIEEIFLGSNSEKIVRFANVPVLIENEKSKNDVIKNIVLASKFNEDLGEEFRQVKDLIENLGANIHLVSINTPHNFESTFAAESRMKKFKDKWGLVNATISHYSHERFETGLYLYAKSIGAQAIAIGTHGRKGLGHLFYGSLAEDVVNHFPLPILTFKIQKN